MSNSTKRTAGQAITCTLANTNYSVELSEGREVDITARNGSIYFGEEDTTAVSPLDVVLPGQTKRHRLAGKVLHFKSDNASVVGYLTEIGAG